MSYVPSIPEGVQDRSIAQDIDTQTPAFICHLQAVSEGPMSDRGHVIADQSYVHNAVAVLRNVASGGGCRRSLTKNKAGVSANKRRNFLILKRLNLGLEVLEAESGNECRPGFVEITDPQIEIVEPYRSRYG
jgi:hypothetical protein